MPSVLSGPHRGHALEVANGPERVADAIRRGRVCNRDFYDDINFFDYAQEPLETLRREWNIVPKDVSLA